MGRWSRAEMLDQWPFCYVDEGTKKRKKGQSNDRRRD